MQRASPTPQPRTPACPTTATFPFRAGEDRPSRQVWREIFSYPALDKALRRLDASEDRRRIRLLQIEAAPQPWNKATQREASCLKRVAGCRAALLDFKSGARRAGAIGFTDMPYELSGGYGRLFAQQKAAGVKTKSLMFCPRELRPVLCSELLLDLDLKTALPTIASQLDILGLASSENLVLLKRYCAEKDSFLRALIVGHGIEPLGANSAEGIAKLLGTAILFGGDAGYAGWLRQWGSALERRNPERDLLSFFVDMQAEVARLQNEVAINVKDALAAMRADSGEPPNAKQAKADKQPKTVFAKVTQEIEACILALTIPNLESRGWTVHSLQQDGLLVAPPPGLRPAEGCSPSEQQVTAAKAALLGLAQEAEEIIRAPPPTGLGLAIRWDVKDLFGADASALLAGFD